MNVTPNRRSFLIAGGLTALASTRAFGANEKIRIGVIGAGGRMHALLSSAEASGVPFEIVSVSDVYAPNREQVKTRPSATAATTHMDFREVLDDKSIDAVLIATPDHWHVRIACAALAAGKDVYLEKPVTHTLEEGAALLKGVRSSKQILQCGMQQRSWSHFRNAVALIQGGALGRVTQVRTYWWQNYDTNWVPKPIDESQLDWKQWLGGAPDQPFNLETYSRWRWFWNFGGGAMTDLFAHWIDVAQWAMKADEPSMAFMLGDNYVMKQWQCPDTIQAAFRYPGFDVVYEGMMSSSIDDGGLEFRGTQATLKITRSGMTVWHEGVKSAQNPVMKEDSFEDGTTTHMRNFFECVKTRKEPNAPVEAGVAAARAGHIGNLAYHKGGHTAWPANA
ncbi:Gfo/Idh/MocA family protein [Granulicella sibirica]|uniref:Myo-inositol 2-dehydrogenase n=1 Tax=Granulicella sibirica TaxID=2479048 RepID=A0A4Q0SZJ4_9BACT|nr:Gfo/Idh/MocA family oxidoreductase [Granulicella sibirica]RXH54506.1 Myo-inositol 2-dehydrogenase [Granulicella sibirica]